jgi:hypothetical protein
VNLAMKVGSGTGKSCVPFRHPIPRSIIISALRGRKACSLGREYF